MECHEALEDGHDKGSQTKFGFHQWKEVFVQERDYEAQKEGYRRNEVDTIFRDSMFAHGKMLDRWKQALLDATVPVQLINGPLDPVSGRHLAEYWQELLPDSETVIIAAQV